MWDTTEGVAEQNLDHPWLRMARSLPQHRMRSLSVLDDHGAVSYIKNGVWHQGDWRHLAAPVVSYTSTHRWFLFTPRWADRAVG